jgi:hypothetical protein
MGKNNLKSTPFNPDNDLAPIPFDQKTCELARALKTSGLEWRPQVGCFVWDPEGIISVPSPFPNRIYFVLNLNHFLKIFNTEERIKEKLVWLPSWHQAREICHRMNIPSVEIVETLMNPEIWTSRQEIYILYQLILNNLKSG